MPLVYLAEHIESRVRYPSTPSSSCSRLPLQTPTTCGRYKSLNRPSTSTSASASTCPSTTSLTRSPTSFDLSSLADTRLGTGKPRKTRSKSFKGVIMRNRLVKAGKKESAQTDNTLCTAKVESVHALLPSPVIRPPPSPLSPLFPPAKDRLLAPSERAHRRSRSFSELVTSSKSPGHSHDQPWRSREAWAALYSTPRPPPETILPSAMGDEGWRAKGGGGTFFGADMNIPLPGNQRVRSKPSSPSRPLQFQSHAIFNQESRYPSPFADYPPRAAPASIGQATPLYRHASKSASRLGPDDTSSDEEHQYSAATPRWYTPIGVEDLDNRDRKTEGGYLDDNIDLLPPLLPKTVTRASSFSSTSRNTTPIPWAQRSVGGSSGTRTPTQSPRTPSRQAQASKLNASSPLSSAKDGTTPKTWLQINPSPPRREKSHSPRSCSPLTPKTPPPHRRTLFHGREGKQKQGTIRRSISPHKAREEKGAFTFSHRDHEGVSHHDVITPVNDKDTPTRSPWKASSSSPGKRFWRSPIVWATERRANREGRKVEV